MASPGCRRWQHKGLTSTHPALNRYGRSRSALYRADMTMGNPAQWPFHAPRAHPASPSPAASPRRARPRWLRRAWWQPGERMPAQQFPGIAVYPTPFPFRRPCQMLHLRCGETSGVERIDQMLIRMLCRICRCFTSGPREREHAAKPEGKAGGEPPPEGAGKPQAGGKNRQGAGRRPGPQ